MGKHSISGRRGSIHRRGGDFGIGLPVRRATALWLLYLSSSFLCARDALRDLHRAGGPSSLPAHEANGRCAVGQFWGGGEERPQK